MTISIRMTEEQKKIAEAYAKCEGVNLSEAIKRAFLTQSRKNTIPPKQKPFLKKGGEEKRYHNNTPIRCLEYCAHRSWYCWDFWHISKNYQYTSN